MKVTKEYTFYRMNGEAVDVPDVYLVELTYEMVRAAIEKHGGYRVVDNYGKVPMIKMVRNMVPELSLKQALALTEDAYNEALK